MALLLVEWSMVVQDRFQAEVVGRSGEMPTLSDGFITQDFILLILLVVFTKGLYDLDKDFFEEHQRIVHFWLSGTDII